MVLLGGKHRSLTEFRELARAAGLEVLAAGPQASGYFVVECRPTQRRSTRTGRRSNASTRAEGMDSKDMKR